MHACMGAAKAPQKDVLTAKIMYKFWQTQCEFSIYIIMYVMCLFKHTALAGDHMLAASTCLVDLSLWRLQGLTGQHACARMHLTGQGNSSSSCAMQSVD